PQHESWVVSINVTRAALDNPVEITVYNLTDWLATLPNRDGVKPNEWDVVPFINGVPLRGVTPESVKTTDAVDWAKRNVKSTELRFRLKRTEGSKTAWTTLLNRPVLSKPVEVSVGIP